MRVTGPNSRLNHLQLFRQNVGVNSPGPADLDLIDEQAFQSCLAVDSGSRRAETERSETAPARTWSNSVSRLSTVTLGTFLHRHRRSPGTRAAITVLSIFQQPVGIGFGGMPLRLVASA